MRLNSGELVLRLRCEFAGVVALTAATRLKCQIRSTSPRARAPACITMKRPAPRFIMAAIRAPFIAPPRETAFPAADTDQDFAAHRQRSADSANTLGSGAPSTVRFFGWTTMSGTEQIGST